MSELRTDLLLDVLKRAQARGATAADGFLIEEQHFTASVRLGQVDTVKHGIYAVNFGGGQVDITNGKFVFSASEAYMIEEGQITAPIKGATLIGNGPDVLTRVSMVGNDLKLDEGAGTCGKDGQAVPVGVGIPTLKVDRLTVGGTARKDPGGFMQ